PLGEVEAGLHCLRECESLAEALGDRQRLGGVFARMGESFWQIGDYARAIEVGERARTIAGAFADVVMEWSATENLGFVYHAVGDYRRAVDCLKKSVALLEGNRRYEYFGRPILGSVYSRMFLVWTFAELGDFTEGMTIAEEALQIGESLGHPLNLVSAHLGL